MNGTKGRAFEFGSAVQKCHVSVLSVSRAIVISREQLQHMTTPCNSDNLRGRMRPRRHRAAVEQSSR